MFTGRSPYLLAQAVISAHDYTFARGRLAISVPSKPWEHQGDAYTAYGHHRVQQILADEPMDDCFRNAPVVAQCSSLGTMSQKYIDELSASFAPRGATEKKACGKPSFQLIWPSVSEVQHSLEGWFGGGSVCGTKERLFKPALVPLLHRWGGDVTGRQRALPHMKTFLRYTENEGSIRLPWVFLTSSNCSKAALGEAVNSKKYQAKLLRILSFEMGIVLLPRYELAYRQSRWFGWSCTGDRTTSTTKTVASVTSVHFVPWSSTSPSEHLTDDRKTLVVPIPLPFPLPPRSYHLDPDSALAAKDADYESTPWFAPAEEADAWTGGDMLGNRYPGRGTYQGLTQRGTPDTLWQDLFGSAGD